MTDTKLYRHRVLGRTDAVHGACPLPDDHHPARRLAHHRFPLRYRDVQELLYHRGFQVCHETLRERCIKFGPLFAEALRHREPRWGSRWHLDEAYTSVDEHGFVLDVLLQRHRDTEAAKTS